MSDGIERTERVINPAMFLTAKVNVLSEFFMGDKPELGMDYVLNCCVVGQPDAEGNVAVAFYLKKAPVITAHTPVTTKQ